MPTGIHITWHKAADVFFSKSPDLKIDWIVLNRRLSFLNFTTKNGKNTLGDCLQIIVIFIITFYLILSYYQCSQKMSIFLRTIFSVKCLQDKYVRVFYGHVCLLILWRFWLYKKRTLFLLFLPNISYPSPTQNFYFEKGKKFWILLGPNPILICSH